MPVRTHPESQPAPFVRWSVESFGIRLSDDLGRRSLALEFPAAAVWEFITQGRSQAETAHLTSAVTGLADDAARTLVADLTQAWRSDHWLTAAPTPHAPWPTFP